MAALHKHRERKKAGLAIFHLVLDPLRVEFTLERLGMLSPNMEHDMAMLEKVLTMVLNDWLEE